MEIEELKIEVESVSRGKAQAVALNKEFEGRLIEMSGKIDDAIRQLTEANYAKTKLVEENLAFSRRNETLEFELTSLQTTHRRVQADFEEARLQLESEMAVRRSSIFTIRMSLGLDQSYITINGEDVSNGFRINEITIRR